MKITIILILVWAGSISFLHAQDTIAIRSGWNLIGAVSTKGLNHITTEPPGIIASYYFGYSSAGYTVMDTLFKGAGYWVKAGDSGMLIFGTAPVDDCPATVNYAGKNYNTIQIGTQCWFQDNLDVGTMKFGSYDQTNNDLIEKYCYHDSIENCSAYGGLYQWNEAMQYSTTPGVQGICPSGWHIPTNSEFETLRSAVGEDGNALKSIGQGAGDGAGTNTSGFSALLAGYRTNYGDFNILGYYMYTWSSTEYDSADADFLNLVYNNGNISLYHFNKSYGFSVRCLKD